MRKNRFILCLLVLSMSRTPPATAQVPANMSAEQLMQIMRSQPAVDISAPVTATALFDPPVVRPGEKAIYRVKLNATAVSVKWPEKLPAPPGLSLRLTGTGQTLQNVDGRYQNLAGFVHEARADAPGRFTMPEFTVEVYGQPVVIPAAQLEVKTDLPEPHEPARQLRIEASATNVYVGEVFDVSVLLPATVAGIGEAVADLQLNAESFVVDKNQARQAIRPVTVNGRTVTSYVYETTLTPIAAGKLNVSAQGFTAGMIFGGQITINGQVTIPGGPPSFNLLDSEPVTINVGPLPAGSELPGFSGAVGSYTLDPPSLATNVLKAGEPVKLTVVIRGQKNLGRLNPPLPPHANGWQVFPAERGAILPADGNLEAGASFKYTLIPLSETVRATPAIPFSCFDPASGKYVDLTIPALPVTVLPGEAAAADTVLMTSENPAGDENKASLSKLSPSPGWAAGGLVPWQLHGWFPLVQVFPALGFCGLWFWDRRRRFLEQHPEIVRQRAAKRALRRERRLLDQAAEAGDAENFVRRGIHALQIASAPHYPAAPQALVCSDVLQILATPDREGKSGETVRRFFAAADAAAFGNSTETRTGLLAEKSGLQEILLKLEARL